jgi:UDP-N-acetylmuramyl pentapeptide phosphotransferase/UDP-N-acetylglucosamine-1-phosphate transferase
MIILIGSLFAGIFSYVAVGHIRRFGERHAILDVPNHRSSHSMSVPKGGGLAIVVVTLLAMWLYLILNSSVSRWTLTVYTIGAILIVIISGLDDLHPQSSMLRLAVQSLGAVLAIYGFGTLPISQALRFTAADVWLNPVLTFLWIVGLTNAYNFMDGIDGLAGGQAVVAGLGWMVLGWLGGQPLVLVLGLLIAATSFGFLLHNWSPARIFMGDVGSAFLGYTFAVFPLMLNSKLTNGRDALKVISLAILPVWPFVFDATFTILRRLRRGENVFSAHRSHLYQRLVIAGHTHRSISLLYCILAVLGALLSVGWALNLRSVAPVTVVVLPLIGLTLCIFVTKQEQRQARRLTRPQPTFVDPV